MFYYLLLGPNKWVSWDKTGYSAPTSIHAPVAHSMSSNFFNGKINVFVFGEDGYTHHIWQTTCDKVPNPWGWCTWSLWYKIGNAIPETAKSANPLSIGANIHHGIEVWQLLLSPLWCSFPPLLVPFQHLCLLPTVVPLPTPFGNGHAFIMIIVERFLFEWETDCTILWPCQYCNV